MRLCVISDTHIPDRYEEIPKAVINEIVKSDLTIHAGDFTSLDTYEKLAQHKPLKAVLGNMDCPQLRAHMKEKEIFMCKKFKIGIMHGFGKPETVLENIRKSFDNTFHLVIFGHTHNPFNEKIGKTIYFNPGSPTDKIFASHNSFGIININETIETEIIRL